MLPSSLRRGAAMLIAVLVGLAIALVPSPAQADEHDGLLSCPLGHYQQDYHPALLAQTRQVELDGTGSFGPCISLTRPELDNAEFELNATGQLNCITGGNSEGNMRFQWNNGAITKVDYPLLALTIRPGGQTVAIVTGEVVSGPFDGGTMVFESNLLTDEAADCLLGLGGIDSAAGPATVSFVDL